ncbi:MAG: ribosome maturation factor RimM [SAR202 cluster bacterium]|nr:ribosome maturation factor RimM [SAR202 cluster bacterium]
MPETSADNPTDASEPVLVGTITGAWGLNGQVKVRSHSDDPDRFATGRTVHVDGRPARIMSTREAGSAMVIKFDIVVDRTHAEKMRGVKLTVPPEELEPLPPGSYYHYQLIGLEVHDEAGARLGDIVEVIFTGANDVYVVREGKRETLVPALADVIVSVDIDSERSNMVVRLPEGL